MYLHENSEENAMRIAKLRKMSRKLARNQSRGRVVRKMPQTIFVERGGSRPVPVLRTSINRNKRLVYMMLLGAVMSLYVSDMDNHAWMKVYSSLESLKTASLPIP